MCFMVVSLLLLLPVGLKGVIPTHPHLKEILRWVIQGQGVPISDYRLYMSFVTPIIVGTTIIYLCSSFYVVQENIQSF